MAVRIRIGSAAQLKSATKAWEADHSVVRWRFTSADARTRLHRLCSQC